MGRQAARRNPGARVRPSAEEKRLHWDEAEPHLHEHGHGSEDGDMDPHFWSDPMTVKAMLPGLGREAIGARSRRSKRYAVHAERFAAELDTLDAEVAGLMAPLKGRPVVIFILMELLSRTVWASPRRLVEAAPGKEASPQYLAQLLETLKKEHVTASVHRTAVGEAPGGSRVRSGQCSTL